MCGVQGSFADARGAWGIPIGSIDPFHAPIKHLFHMFLYSASAETSFCMSEVGLGFVWLSSKERMEIFVKF
jgi:hypothetical protein